MSLDRIMRELAFSLLVGFVTVAGVKLATRLQDPYSEPRLTVGSWFDSVKGG